ncbi:RB-associated KRAB zinc finger protein-like [Drosophila subpulchrella]|uniref:RB-associated KRAB zinc finger protein-like n=1 Tax=Drosophila subpulchrella TaxID=1486046 RepID=UPI0018A18648|nr:RB-associated KRAB zinc finger protein-like [Drosophila subpulchrella]XP_037719490.1 RB-associated KRAB zinc finger protein-like [Drosophila subpulchrella]
MESPACRVCLRTGEDLLNIFEETVEFGVSIAGMISKCTGLKVEKGDCLPDSICPSCLRDAKNAFKVKQSYERNRQLYCRPKKATPNIESRVPSLDASDTKEDAVDDLREKEEPYGDEFQGQVRNEPLKEDLFEEEHDPESECEIGSYDDEAETKMVKDDFQGNEDNDVDCEPSNYDDENNGFLYKCYYCPKTFTSKSALTIHSRKHTGDRPFKCTDCGKTFSHNTYLQRHLVTHSDKPFKCSICEKTFAFCSMLESHYRKHSGEQPFNCTRCSKSCPSLGHLKAHVRKHHLEEQDFKCTYCPKSYSRLKNLKLHLRKHTG